MFVVVPGLSLILECGLSSKQTSVVETVRLQSVGSVVVVHRPAASRVFPDQGSNPCPLHWQVDSQPLDHQGSPKVKVKSLSHV